MNNWTFNPEHLTEIISYKEAPLYITKENCLSYLSNYDVWVGLEFLAPLLILLLRKILLPEKNNVDYFIIVGGMVWWAIRILIL